VTPLPRLTLAAARETGEFKDTIGFDEMMNILKIAGP